MKTNFTWINQAGERVILDVEDHVAYSDAVAITEAVVAAVMNNGHYRPYMKEVALYTHLLKVYAGIEFPTSDDLMEAIQYTNLLEAFADKAQCKKINDDVDKMIAHELNKSSLDHLCDYALILAKTGNLLNIAEDVANTLEKHVNSPADVTE